jgi:hypothetical protein
MKDDVKIKNYARGVLNRAGHHAPTVIDVFPALVGFVYTYADEGSIEHMQREGFTGNVTWAKFKGRRIAFSYNHETGCIEAREGSTHGKVLGSADNNTSNRDLTKFFKNL